MAKLDGFEHLNSGEDSEVRSVNGDMASASTVSGSSGSSVVDDLVESAPDYVQSRRRAGS